MMKTQLIEAHREHVDARLGLRERFLQIGSSAGWTHGVLSTSLHSTQAVGWVMCHSFGAEHIYVNATEVAIARALATDGFPVLRFHCQGYGDSEHVEDPASPSTHVRDTQAAVEAFKPMTEVDNIGVIGARFGGTVAGLVAHHLRLPFVGMISPVVHGPRYLSDLLRTRVFEAVATSEGVTVDSLRRSLEEGRVVSVRGFPLHAEAAGELASIDLPRALDRFAGHALVLHLSRSQRESRTTAALVDRLQKGGADVDYRTLVHPMTGLLGDHHFQAVRQDVMGDALADLSQRVAGSVLTWARRVAGVQGASR